MCEPPPVLKPYTNTVCQLVEKMYLEDFTIKTCNVLDECLIVITYFPASSDAAFHITLTAICVVPNIYRNTSQLFYRLYDLENPHFERKTFKLYNHDAVNYQPRHCNIGNSSVCILAAE